MRNKITMTMPPEDLLDRMTEGNPGAIRVMIEIFDKHGPEGIFTVITMDDMNIRGSQIWVGYKDHCKQNIDKFIKAIKNRDKKMIETINKEMGMDSKYEEVAVVSGASAGRNKKGSRASAASNGIKE